MAAERACSRTGNRRQRTAINRTRIHRWYLTSPCRACLAVDSGLPLNLTDAKTKSCYGSRARRCGGGRRFCRLPWPGSWRMGLPLGRWQPCSGNIDGSGLSHLHPNPSCSLATFLRANSLVQCFLVLGLANVRDGSNLVIRCCTGKQPHVKSAECRAQPHQGAQPHNQAHRVKMSCHDPARATL